ncbi:MAG: spermidine/putrescine ABC transporter substrate-binding protein [Nitrospirota bacterium]|nr:spermidine/putrescine ABC transporter substrate-binding protein [Nitrospirota bacterium]MDH5775652.1 spermidine/putrescine ABC transporter substrate-binding protein [Nitrospirota bacterium]
MPNLHKPIKPTCWAVFFLGVLLLGGCSDSTSTSQSGAADQPRLHYFTWSDYVDPEILAAFETSRGVRVVVDTFSSNEELLAKIQTGMVGYDVVVPSDFMAGIMGRLGLLAKLDLSRIPHVQDLETHLKQLPFDPTQQFAIPYLWGTVGIGYNSKVVTEVPTSWNVLWDPHYAGRISMLNDQREVFGLALRALGHSLNSRDPQLIQEAKERLIQQKPLVKAYTSEQFDQLLVSGDVVLAHAWGGPVARAMREDPLIRYTIPQEGGTIWADCLAVLASSKQKELAMDFINYLLSDSVAIQTSTRLLFASANRHVRHQLPPEIRENIAVYPPDDVLPRMEWLEDVQEATRDYDRAWTELKVH